MLCVLQCECFRPCGQTLVASPLSQLLVAMARAVVIGISGPSRACKTSLAEALTKLQTRRRDGGPELVYIHDKGVARVRHFQCANCDRCCAGDVKGYCCAMCSQHPAQHGPRRWGLPHVGQRYPIAHHDAFRISCARMNAELVGNDACIEPFEHEAFHSTIVEECGRGDCDVLVVECFRIFWDIEAVGLMDHYVWLCFEQAEVYKRRMATTWVPDEYFYRCIWPEQRRYGDHVRELGGIYPRFRERLLALSGIMATHILAACIIARFHFGV